MCGIAGYAGFDDEPLLRRMCLRLFHRGPDEDGHFIAPGVGLAMRRLAIIDLATGKQPIANETGDVVVVFNGEIYNFESVRTELLARGHVFETKSDTETIVHAYEEDGLRFVERLRGMFGIALWDATRRRLVLARDRLGEKPLYYAWDGRRLLFGSEIKAILAGLRSRSVDPQAVCDFLAAGYVGGDHTFFSEIQKLPPGHMLVWENGTIDLRRYWRIDPAATETSMPYREALEHVDRELNEAVRLCLKSDVEVGAFLSGGVDSSLIVALMRRNSNARIQTFSVGYDGAAAGFNELGYAARVAKHVGTEHHELILDANSSIDLLPRIIWHYDEPHGEPTSVLVYLLCEFVRRRVKVALGGTGGDEFFYGYPRHAGLRYLQRYRRLPLVLRRHVFERLFAAIPESTRGSRLAKRVNRFIAGASLPSNEAYLAWVSMFGRDVRDGLVSAAVRSAAHDPTGEHFLRSYLDGAGPDVFRAATALDVGGYLAEYQLAYMDRMSMAHSLEVRSPLCDYRVAEMASRLPTDYRLHGSRSKRILKDVAVRYLPEEIVNRRKVGFDSPIGQWFKDELRPFLATFLSREQVAKSGLLDPAAVQRVVDDHLAGRRDYSLQLWSLVALETWHRMYIEGEVQSVDGYSLSDVRGGRREAA